MVENKRENCQVVSCPSERESLHGYGPAPTSTVRSDDVLQKTSHGDEDSYYPRLYDEVDFNNTTLNHIPFSGTWFKRGYYKLVKYLRPMSDLRVSSVSNC